MTFVSGTFVFLFSMKRVETGVSELLKRHAARPVIEADLKLVKDTAASEHVKTDSKPLRKAYGSCHLLWANGKSGSNWNKQSTKGVVSQLEIWTR